MRRTRIGYSPRAVVSPVDEDSVLKPAAQWRTMAARLGWVLNRCRRSWWQRCLARLSVYGSLNLLNSCRLRCAVLRRIGNGLYLSRLTHRGLSRGVRCYRSLSCRSWRCRLWCGAGVRCRLQTWGEVLKTTAAGARNSPQICCRCCLRPVRSWFRSARFFRSRPLHLVPLARWFCLVGVDKERVAVSCQRACSCRL